MSSLSIDFLNCGIIKIEEPLPIVECYVVPRESCTYAANNYIKNKNCVYFLIDSMEGRKTARTIYVGQTTNFGNRKADHSSKKKWWNEAIVFCFNSNDVNVILGVERIFIEKYDVDSEIYIFDGKKKSTAYIDPSYYKAETSIQTILNFLKYPAPLAKNEKVSSIEPVLTKCNSKKPSFKFSMCGLKEGDKIYLTKVPTIIAVIVNENSVIYNEKIYSLSNLAQQLLGMKHAPQGPACWSYNGKTLDEIRKDKGN